MLNSSGSGFPR
jgi:hypothetical protein